MEKHMVYRIAFTFNVIADSSIQFTDDYLMPEVLGGAII